MLKILFVTSEAYPLMKTGGLGDVSSSLPRALHDLGCDVRILMPAYGDTQRRASDARRVATLALSDVSESVHILETTLPSGAVPVWLVDCEPLFGRPGNPYLTPEGQNWPDNAYRFTIFSRAAVELAQGRTSIDWRPDVVHSNDWQSGLVPALLQQESPRPATLFTVHNLAYQGLFPYDVFTSLNLPAALWSADAMEFYNQIAFIKGGLVYADRITTVSPTYAREIQTPEFGCGLDGLLRTRASVLRGIVNGIDTREWNPAGDPHLAKPFDIGNIEDKFVNKLALQRELQLPHEDGVPIIGMVGRLVHQKGLDLVIEALPRLVDLPIQLVVLGSGAAEYASQLENWARRLPRQIAVRIGYDEGLAHRIEAGADMFLMPSRFEPCGLNQLYSLRYGTVPIVRRVGGLADTVVEATPAARLDRAATGFIIEREDASSIVDAVAHALELYRERDAWSRLVDTGMRADYSWHNSADSYIKVYEEAVSERSR